MMKRSLKIFLAVISAVVTIAIIATVSLSVMTFMKVSAMEQAEADVPTEAPDQDGEGEDNIKIGGEYLILSTKAISDAYLSGDSSALSDRDRETLDMASAVLDEVIVDGMDAYEKEQAVFLWMNENIGFDRDVTVLVRTDITTDNPHGVLSSRSAVCVGYATTFRLFMQMLDIPCMVVHDTALVHSWDLVQIEGHWYHVDLYSAQNCVDPLVYLNRPDVIQSILGSEWDTTFYPAADSFDWCYLYRQAVKANDIYTIPEEVKNAIDEDRSLVSLLFDEGEYDDVAVEYLLSNMESRLMGSVEYQDCYISHIAVLTDDGSLFAAIMIEKYDYSGDDDDYGLTEEEIERIDKAITDSFGELTDIAYDDDWFYDYAE